LLFFSPEIQKDELSNPTSGDTGEPILWGDVFVKTGEEYPFLFTLYTKQYAQDQLLCYGEKIEVSAKDVVLNRKDLSRADIIRAVIKWTNLYCPFLMGKPIALEEHSVLQGLACDPFVEVQCPESIF